MLIFSGLQERSPSGLQRFSVPLSSSEDAPSKIAGILDRVVILGEGYLRLLVRQYVEHHHTERNHQGLDNKLLSRAPPPANLSLGVQRRGRIGGLLNGRKYIHGAS